MAASIHIFSACRQRKSDGPYLILTRLFDSFCRSVMINETADFFIFP